LLLDWYQLIVNQTASQEAQAQAYYFELQPIRCYGVSEIAHSCSDSAQLQKSKSAPSHVTVIRIQQR